MGARGLLHGQRPEVGPEYKREPDRRLDQPEDADELDVAPVAEAAEELERDPGRAQVEEGERRAGCRADRDLRRALPAHAARRWLRCVHAAWVAASASRAAACEAA